LSKEKYTTEFFATLRRRFDSAAEQEREIREAAREDIRFVAGEQWPEKQKKEREAAGRPAHVHNRLQAFCNQVANEARLNTPQVRFSPVEDADDDTAEIYEGLARHIQYASRAGTAYETATEHQTAGSFGYFRMLADYCDPQSFDQELRIDTVTDPFTVYGVLIPWIRRQKARFAFVIETLTRDEYKVQYGETDDFKSFEADDASEGWITDDEVRIAEYWCLETETKTIAQLADGRVVDADDVPAGAKVLKTRETEVDTVCWYKTNGAEVLEETEWVGSRIPIYPVTGKSLVVDGKPQIFSLVRFMRDPQQLINYTKSRIAESLAVAPISPWIVAEGQIDGRENEWATSNTVLRAALQYKPVAIGTTVVGAPQRQVYEPPIQALSQFLLQEIEELKAISGLYDPIMGDNPANQSGVAIRQQREQGAITNKHFMGNLARAHEECGIDIAEAIRKIYDAPRMVRILGADETPKIVKVNELYADPATGKTTNYNLSAGKYDITVTTGKAYSTKKLETFDALSTLVQANPALMQVIGDLIFRNSDMAGADQIADRMKKMLPAQLQDEDENAPQIPARFKAAFDQSQQVIEQLTEMLQQAEREREAKTFELRSRERIVELQEETKRAIAAAQIDQEDRVQLLMGELAAIRHRLDLTDRQDQRDQAAAVAAEAAQEQPQEQAEAA
jgi:hypothetical protein